MTPKADSRPTAARIPRRRAWTPALLFALLLASAAAPRARAQDDQKPFDIDTVRNDNSRLRLAVADFKSPAEGQAFTYRRAFDGTLFADLAAAGIFDLVPKAMAPANTPGFPAEINLGLWSAAPANASMVAFGNVSVQNNRLLVSGFLDDAKNPQFPQIFARQYNEAPSEDSARQIAHRFADEIIARLGGGLQGIAETKIYFVHIGGGVKDIWEMDYDGANQHPVTHLGQIALSPRISPDNSRLAYSVLQGAGWQIQVHSLLLNRNIRFESTSGTDVSPAWAPNGTQIAFSSSRSGEPEIWVADAEGRGAHKITSFRGGNVSPTWNPKTGSQIAWISGRTGLPQLYIMDADGSGVQRLTDGGYATSPSWSPNGQFVAFAWNRKYGPGAPGGQDIYVMEISTKRWIQLTHDTGRCDFPSWSPDGRHIVYANSPDGRAEHTRIMTMFADGTGKRALTGSGADMPNWSWK